MAGVRHDKRKTSAQRAPRLEVGERLSLDDALAGSRSPHRLVLGRETKARVAASASRIARAVAGNERIYGVTTGFGSNSDETIAPRDAARLQHHLLVSHALGDGPPLSDETVRLALLLRIHALARGASGIRPSTLAALMRLYEADVLAVVPCRGSVGASGDLAPLAHLALPLLGLGRVRVGGRETSAAKALAAAGLSPLELGPKEGLALVNGMQISLAIGLLALERAERLLRMADLAAALALEAFGGRAEAFDERLHAARGHPGQQTSAARIRAWTHGSRLVGVDAAHLPGKRRWAQDPYSLRCAPQVHGASIDAIAYVREALAREVDAATDNPLVFGEDILSGGNFHGQPIALPLDHMRLAVHELGSIAERRVATLVDPATNEGLPAYLAPQKGLHSGFMIPQYLAAAQVSESKGLCFPASADSIPTGGNVEDHVSMAPIAARRTLDVVELVESTLALDVLVSCQAIDLRVRMQPNTAPGPRTAAIHKALRRVVPFREADELWLDALAQTRAFLRSIEVDPAA